MEPGKTCPNCAADIGVWPVVRASLPWRIWCPHCSARLQYRDARGFLLSQLSLGIALVGIAAIVVFAFGRGRFPNINPFDFDFALRLIVFVVVSCAAGLSVELLSAVFLRNNRALECLAKPSPGANSSSVTCPMCGATINPGMQACVSCGENRAASRRSQ